MATTDLLEPARLALRDAVAQAALTGIIINRGIDTTLVEPRADELTRLSDLAYSLADAMLERR